MVLGATTTSRDGSATRSSSTNEVFPIPKVIGHNSGIPAWNHSRPTAKPDQCREAPSLAPCSKDKPNGCATCHGQDIPPQAVAFVGIPKYRESHSLANLKYAFRIHRIDRMFLRDLENSSGKIKKLGKVNGH